MKINLFGADFQVDGQMIAVAARVMGAVGSVDIYAPFFVEMEQVFRVEDIGVLRLAVELFGEQHIARNDKLVEQQPAVVIR